MRLLLIPLVLISIAACGPSQVEKEKIAAVTCAVMAESKEGLGAAFRVEKINEAREEIGGEPFLSGDVAIKEAFELGLCEALVLNDDYDIKLQPLKDAKAERERIAAEIERLEEEKKILESEEKKALDEARRRHSKKVKDEILTSFELGKQKEKTGNNR